MNYRLIFNPSYNIVGLWIILLLIILIFFIHQNLKKSLLLISKYLLISGIISFVIAIIFIIGINSIIPIKYQIFTNIISKNLLKTDLIYSGICIIIGLLFSLPSYISKKENNNL